jgi:Mg2+ and Co2+ transporter CorA
MTTLPDHDPLIESLTDELRAQMSALNEMHHPVYPSSAKRIAELEQRVADLRAAINQRRKALAPVVASTAP